MFGIEGNLISFKAAEVDEFTFSHSFVNKLMLELALSFNARDEAGLGLLLDTMNVASNLESDCFGSS